MHFVKDTLCTKNNGKRQLKIRNFLNGPWCGKYLLYFELIFNPMSIESIKYMAPNMRVMAYGGISEVIAQTKLCQKCLQFSF